MLNDISSNRIKELQAKPEEIDALSHILTETFLESIHSGEREVLALLKTGRFNDYRFCTGDMRAIVGLSVLELGSLGVSLEEVLSNIGQSKKLPHQSFSKQAFDRQKAKGLMEQSNAIKKKDKKSRQCETW